MGAELELELDNVCAGNPKAQEELKQLRIERAAYEGRMVQAEEEIERLRYDFKRLMVAFDEQEKDLDEWKRRAEMMCGWLELTDMNQQHKARTMGRTLGWKDFIKDNPEASGWFKED